MWIVFWQESLLLWDSSTQLWSRGPRHIIEAILGKNCWGRGVCYKEQSSGWHRVACSGHMKEHNNEAHWVKYKPKESNELSGGRFAVPKMSRQMKIFMQQLSGTIFFSPLLYLAMSTVLCTHELYSGHWVCYMTYTAPTGKTEEKNNIENRWLHTTFTTSISNLSPTLSGPGRKVLYPPKAASMAGIKMLTMFVAWEERDHKFHPKFHISHMPCILPWLLLLMYALSRSQWCTAFCRNFFFQQCIANIKVHHGRLLVELQSRTFIESCRSEM